MKNNKMLVLSISIFVCSCLFYAWTVYGGPAKTEVQIYHDNFFGDKEIVSWINDYSSGIPEGETHLLFFASYMSSECGPALTIKWLDKNCPDHVKPVVVLYPEFTPQDASNFKQIMEIGMPVVIMDEELVDNWIQACDDEKDISCFTALANTRGIVKTSVLPTPKAAKAFALNENLN